MNEKGFDWRMGRCVINELGMFVAFCWEFGWVVWHKHEQEENHHDLLTYLDSALEVFNIMKNEVSVYGLDFLFGDKYLMILHMSVFVPWKYFMGPWLLVQ